MIRLLKERDREQVMELLAPESTLNLFIIGDFENNGFYSDFQDVWGDYDAKGKLRAVLLRYFGSFIPYAPGEFDLDGFVDILRGQGDRIKTFSGIDRVIRWFETYPDLFPESAKKRTLFFVELRNEERLAALRRGLPFRLERAVPNDVPAILDLWREVEEFRVTENTERATRHELEQGACRAHLVRDGRRVVATARRPRRTAARRCCTRWRHTPTTAAGGSPTSAPGSCTR